MQHSLERFRQRLSKHFREVITALIIVLAILFYLTSLLSQTTSLSNILIDVLIYIIYFTLMTTLGSLAFVLYNYYDEENSLLVPSFQQGIPIEAPYLAIEDDSERDEKLLATMMIIDRFKEKLTYNKEGTFTGFERLLSLSDNEIVSYLQQQHPQIIAMILGYMSTSQAEAIATKFTSTMRDEIMRVFQESRIVDDSALARLNKALYKDLSPVKEACKVLKVLTGSEIQNILRKVSKIELMFAFKGASQELREMFFANMSAKASREFKSALSTKQDISSFKSDNAIKNLYLLAQRLGEDGKIRTT